MDSFPQGSQKQKCHSWVNFYSGEWELQMCMCVQIAFPFAPEERDTHLHQKREIFIYITFQKREYYCGQKRDFAIFINIHKTVLTSFLKCNAKVTL